MSVSHCDIDAFFVGFDGFFSVAGQVVGICENSVGIAFVIGLG